MTFEPIPFDRAPAECSLIAAPPLRRVHQVLGDLLKTDAAKTCPIGQLTALQTAHKLIHDAIYFDPDATQELEAVDDVPLADRIIVHWQVEGVRVELLLQPDNSPNDRFPMNAGTLGTITRHPITDQLGVTFDGRGGAVTTGFMVGGIYTPAINAVQPVPEITQS